MSFEEPDTDMVYVANLPKGVIERDIEEFFGAIGILKKDKKTKKSKIWLYRDKGTGELKGDGTVSYEDPYAAKSAVEWFHEKEWKGSVLHVSLAERPDGPYGGGGKRGAREGFRSGGRGFGRDNDRGGGGGGSFGKDSGGYDRGGGGFSQDRRGGGGGGYDNRGGLGGFGGGSRGGHGQTFDQGGGRSSGGYGDGAPQAYDGGPGFNQPPQPSLQENYDTTYSEQPGFTEGDQGYGGSSSQALGGFNGSLGELGTPAGGGSFGQDAGGGGRGPPPPKEMREGDWACTCGNVNFSFRGKCNRCGSAKPSAGGDRGGGRGGGPGRGREKVVAAPQGPAGLFAPEDWACPSCGNMNWARRPKCNMCGTAKPGTVDTNREGAGGGFKELDEQELEEARRRRKQYEEDDNEMYDEFGRLKKRHRSGGGGGGDNKRVREEAALARLYND